jgi:hypothetical protein
MEAVDVQEITEAGEHKNDPFKTQCAMMVSVLAMVLAIASLGGSNAAKEATMNNILAANSFSFYQAKNIRQTALKLAADDLETQMQMPQIPADLKQSMAKRLEGYRSAIARYESEPDTGEGKKELMARAREHEHERDLALARDPWFDAAEALLQIAIVLMSITLITDRRLFFWASTGLGLAGAVCTLNGFLLLV